MVFDLTALTRARSIGRCNLYTSYVTLERPKLHQAASEPDYGRTNGLAQQLAHVTSSLPCDSLLFVMGSAKSGASYIPFLLVAFLLTSNSHLRRPSFLHRDHRVLRCHRRVKKHRERYVAAASLAPPRLFFCSPRHGARQLVGVGKRDIHSKHTPHRLLRSALPSTGSFFALPKSVRLRAHIHTWLPC